MKIASLRLGAPAALAAALLALWSGPAFASGGELPSLVHDIGISLLLAGVLAVIFNRLHIPSIAAFLVAGVLIGPLYFGQVTEPENIDTIAQLGFVLLLFMIGLEIDIRAILKSGRTTIVAGLLQYPLSVAFGFALVKLLVFFGFASSLLGGEYAPIYIGIVMAGSSTLLVVKLFQDSFQLDTEPGRVALSLLIFQDIWAIIVIVLLPSLGAPQIVPILFTFLGIGVLVAIAVVLSRFIVPIAFTWISKVPELIVLGAVSWCFGVVFLGLNLDIFTESLMGFSMHMSVGSGMSALIAGAAIANLPYSTEIVTKVGVVKDFFVTLFFVGLGISIPAPSLTVIGLAVILAIAAMAARQLIFFPLLYWLGCDQRTSEVAAIRLAQISEFGLVIAFLGIQQGHIGTELTGAIIIAFVLTALATSPLFNSAYELHHRLKSLLAAVGFKEPEEAADEESEEFAIALLGLHRDGSSFLHELLANRPELIDKTLVIDYNVRLHEKIRALGAHVEYGDISNSDTLLHAGIDKAKVVFCTISDDLLRGTTTAKLVREVRKLSPNAIIIANAVDTKAARSVYEAGADFVYSPRVEVAKALSEVLGEALSGTIEEYRVRQIEEMGELGERREVIS